VSRLELQALVRRDGGYSLHLELALSAGVTVLIGPSGAGKSTTLDLIAGHLVPTSGCLELDGQPLFSRQAGQRPACNVAVAARRIGYVMQSPALFPHLTVAENLAYGLHRWPPAARRARLGALSESLGLESLLGRRPLSLSGGERQRVALGRALGPEPQALLLDEPLSAVDLGQRDPLLERLAALLLPLAIPVLYVTHSSEEQRFFAAAGRPSLRLQMRPSGDGIEVVTNSSGESAAC
jgi:molybdate transport system ATP-binding protein